jgi:hypothetical protein
MKPSVCLVAAGMEAGNLCLQPWRALVGVAEGLASQGHRVVAVSDVPRGSWHGAVPLVHVPSVRALRWRANGALEAAVACSGAEVIIWHLGLTTAVYQRRPGATGRPVVGFWTAPLYGRRELIGLGPRALMQGSAASLVHLLGAALPRSAVRAGLRTAGIDVLVTQTGTTARQLRAMDLWRGPLTTIPPGPGPAGSVWRAAGDPGATRRQLGYGNRDVVVVYFGPPAPLRGLDLLVRAVALARARLRELRLLVLARRRGNEHAAGMARLRHLIARHHLDGAAQVVDGFLTADELGRRVACADVVALPFQLIPSDAPLSVLEARALGKPLVTTRVGCLPELAGADDELLARPGDARSLCDALLAAAGRLEVGPPPAVRSWDKVGAEWSALVTGL